MAVLLEIEDGDPWWSSPNVWTVPGDDPQGPPGLPIAGKQCYLWARVRNTGQDGVTNATVRFYWANPSVGFDRTTANPVGTAFVALTGGQTADALCLTPWTPVYVNEGHECILAEAFEPLLDPLAAVAAFNVPTDRHVAQRNLSVVMQLSGQSFHLAFEVDNPTRRARVFSLSVKEAKLTRLENLLPLLGRSFELPQRAGRAQACGFVTSPCPDSRAVERAVPRIENAESGPHERRGYSLVGRLEGPAALLEITQEVDGRVAGGLSALVVRAREEAT